MCFWQLTLLREINGVFVTVCYLKALCYAVQWSSEQGGLEVD